MIKTFALGLTALALLGSAAQASVTTYSSQSSFSSATTVTNTAGFESLPWGKSTASFTDGGVRFTKLGIDFYVTYAGQALTQNPNSFPTQALSADGDENFRIALASGATFGSVGMDYATNRFGHPVISLYTLSGALIEAVTVPTQPDTVGFIGIVSTTPIGYVTTTVDRGYIEDTAIDNVQIGPLAAVAGAPEPAAWTLMMLGIGAMGGALRARRKALAT